MINSNFKLHAICSILFFFIFSFYADSKAEIDPKSFKQALEKYAKTEEGQEFLAKTVQRYFERVKFGPTIDEQFEYPLNLIKVGIRPSKGADKASITLYIFSDFQCPFSKQANTTINELLKLYPDQLKVKFLNAPLPKDFHEHASLAAGAALAAWKQGKFWEMHDLIFSHQEKLSLELIKRFAEQLNLNLSQFAADIESDEIQKIISEDLKQVEIIGITGRPSFVIEGKRGGIIIKGNKPIAKFKEIIDRWLSEK